MSVYPCCSHCGFGCPRWFTGHDQPCDQMFCDARRPVKETP